MATLQDLINLTKADGGKFFVMDEKGEAKLVILSVEDYEKLLLGKLQRQIKQQGEDIEVINRQILQAQLLEDLSPKASSPEQNLSATIKGPTITNEPKISKNDLRAEVIDPSFDFEGPKIEIDDL